MHKTLDHNSENPYKRHLNRYTQGSTQLGIGTDYQASTMSDLIQTRCFQFNMAGDNA